MPARRVLAASAWLALLPAACFAADYSSYTGQELYARFCASCHGKTATGDGPVSKSLLVAVPDLTTIARRHGGEFPENWVYRVIDGREYLAVHGSREMPIWGVELWREQGADVTAGEKTRDAVARLVAYLKSLQAVRAPAELPREH